MIVLVGMCLWKGSGSIRNSYFLIEFGFLNHGGRRDLRGIAPVSFDVYDIISASSFSACSIKSLMSGMSF